MSVNALLEVAARMADIESLYRVIEQDPHILDNIDSMPFVETPLHVVAASVDLPGHIQFATEIMILKPSFALKLNPQGLTPIHLALQNGCNRMALRLVDINKDLVRAKMRGGLTPLHLGSQSGNIHLLTEFLKACPDSIEDVTVTGETALHLAIQNNFEAFKFLVKLLKTKARQLGRTILNRKDEDGNTILHIAALNNDREATELLTNLTSYWMEFRAANLMGQTALNLAGSAEIRRILVRPFTETNFKKIRSSIKAKFPWLFSHHLLHISETIIEENRNAYLVAATLVATAIYQAALSPPPAGFQQTELLGNNLHSSSNLSKAEWRSVLLDPVYFAYSATNMCAFLVSIFTIMALLPKDDTWDLLGISTILLIDSYFLSMMLTSVNLFTIMLATMLLFMTSIFAIDYILSLYDETIG